jgi:hypothetical protein
MCLGEIWRVIKSTFLAQIKGGVSEAYKRNSKPAKESKRVDYQNLEDMNKPNSSLRQQ